MGLEKHDERLDAPNQVVVHKRLLGIHFAPQTFDVEAEILKVQGVKIGDFLLDEFVDRYGFCGIQW